MAVANEYNHNSNIAAAVACSRCLSAEGKSPFAHNRSATLLLLQNPDSFQSRFLQGRD